MSASPPARAPTGTPTLSPRPRTAPTASAWSSPATAPPYECAPATPSGPPGEEHWHGATTGNMMCHFAMLEGTVKGHQELSPTEGRSRRTWLEGRTPLVYKPVYKAQQEGPFRPRKRPLTCTFGSGGRI